MDKRVQFDFEVYFTNGGNLKGEEFRLDITGDTITDQELIDYIIDDLRLLMAGKVNILNKQIITEPHKRKTVKQELPSERLIDLSHTIEEGLTTYKGLPPPYICDYLSRTESQKMYEEGTSFQIGKIEMVTNTGTYIDCPFHRFENGKDTAGMELEKLAELEAVVIRIPYTETLEITDLHLRNRDIRNKAVLIHTGWDSHWNTEIYYENHPYLTQSAAEYLRDCQVKLVGIDSHNIDNTTGRNRPVHTILLGAEIVIVEHLCHLNQLPDEGFTFTAAPPKFKGAGTFPVRAFASVQQNV
ncbi:kynurenine formamidase [Chryseobacterium vietnamense]|uniref:Kynurenine formamidase n=1 Tax=Chryseobacterium vietnamense TaxID=866785 RepID=A0ACC6JCB7_9FLAO|nr:cyclase family protein [Chryseobacterium vietnamense]MDR6460569.1 kynurenine formamidase [Chryseobacterium vietnamense]